MIQTNTGLGYLISACAAIVVFPERSAEAVDVKPYHLPSASETYYPDKAAGVDCWLQAINASNAATTAAIIGNLVPGTIAAIMDPFAGGGSSASAARAMQVPFLGIELDPILVCACIAKSLSEPRHATRLLRPSKSRSMDDLAEQLSFAGEGVGSIDNLVASCMAIVQLYRAKSADLEPLSSAKMARELTAAPQAQTSSRVIWGDSTDPASWAALRAPHGRIVIYTSPPFGFRSPKLDADPSITRAAERILMAGGLGTHASAPDIFPVYEQSVIQMVNMAAKFLKNVVLIIEHEPADDGSDCRFPVARRLESEFKDTVRNIRILETQSFSDRGLLSFIVCEMQG